MHECVESGVKQPERPSLIKSELSGNVFQTANSRKRIVQRDELNYSQRVSTLTITVKCNVK